MAYQSKHTGKQIDDGIDAVGSKLGKTDNLANNIVTFAEAEERTDIASGETAGTLFGKISKWLKSLGKVAFSNDYNDLDNLPTISGGITSETDPTVPSWAKQPEKPTYTKSEVGLSNVDNVKQYSTSNPPPYPVTSVNGQTGDVEISGGGGEISNDVNTSIPIYKIWVGTQEEYEAITTLDANTEYNIIEE